MRATAPPTPAPVSERHPDGSSALARLLDAILRDPAREAEIAAEIDRRFGEEAAVLILDMSGFMRLTQRYGIAAFLLMIHRMRRTAAPAIAQHGGLLVKAEADNLLCRFAGVGDALAGARAVMRLLDEGNRGLPADRHIRVAIGIGYGRILNIDGHDLFGDEVNLASKLGEDTAGPGEILLTPRAMREAEREGLCAREAVIEISGVAVSYFCCT